MKSKADWIRRHSITVVLLFAVIHSPSSCAVDCKTATSKVDKAICAGNDLSNQDAKLNDDYGKVMTMLSPEGQTALRDDQREWLRYRPVACGFAGNDAQPGDLRCLSQQYLRRDDRLLWLIANQQRPSPYVFFVRSFYETTPDPSSNLPFWSESSFPQIDRQSLSASIAWSDAQAWNTLIAKLIGGPAKTSVCPDGNGDIYREPHIDASVLLITVTLHRDDQCRFNHPRYIELHGRGPYLDFPQDHFMSDTQYSIVMMRGDVHVLQADDLFLPGDGWKQLFTDLLTHEVQKQARFHHEDWHPSPEAIERAATDPSNWIPGRQAFTIRINQATLSADEFIGGTTVTIPWSDLQGVLSFKGKRILNAPTW